MVFEILKFDFCLEQKRQLETTFYMNVSTLYINEKMKELVYPPPNIVRC